MGRIGLGVRRQHLGAVEVEELPESSGVPHCECGGVIKPDVVLYEESLDEDVMARAIHYIRQADMLIIAGTSLTVYPAASLIRYFRSSDLVLINRDPTPMDNRTSLTIHGKVGEVLGGIALMAFLAVVAVDAPMQLQHVFTAGHLEPDGTKEKLRRKLP